MGDTHRLSRTLNHQGLNSLALDQLVDAQSYFYSALRLAYEGGSLPSTLTALTGLAALETHQKTSPETLEMVLYILQHPASAQETKDLATQLRLELESRLPQEEIEAAQQRVASKNLDDFVRPVLTGLHSR